MKILLRQREMLWFLVFILSLGLITLACDDGSSSEGQSFEVEGTPLPTPTLTPITLQEIEQTKEDLTDMQWEDYKPTLVGLRVRWKARVTDISEDGTIYLDTGEEGFLTSVYLDGIARETASKVNKDQIVTVEATITKVSDILGLSIYLDHPTDFVFE